jgi:hypothetical protein
LLQQQLWLLKQLVTQQMSLSRLLQLFQVWTPEILLLKQAVICQSIGAMPCEVSHKRSNGTLQGGA